MASVQVVIPDRIYKNGLTPIYLQFIIDRQKYKKQIYRVEPEYIDRVKKEVKSKHPHAVRINRLIHKRLSEAKAYILDCSFNDEPVSPSTFWKLGAGGSDLISYLKEREDSLRKQGNISRANTYKVIGVKVTASKVSTKINHINSDWIAKFNTHLIDTGIGPGTRGLYLASLSPLFKSLQGQGLMKVNPLIDYKMPSGTGTKERYTIDEFNIIKSMPLDGKLHHVRQMFVFATMARGMRAFDVMTLRWTQVENGRLKYTSQKSGKVFDIEITPAMALCLDGLPANKEYVFPFVKLPWSVYKSDKELYLKHTISKNNAINQNYLSKIEALSGIQKHLTMHVARHTFSAIWLEAGVDLRVLQAFLGHSDIKTTMKYASEIKQGERLDKEAEGLF